MNLIHRLRGKSNKQSNEPLNDKPAPTVSTMNLEMLFYRDGGSQSYHGTIYADHVHNERQKNEIISFHFKDVHPVPALTPELMAYIFEQAKTFGWNATSLRSYATVMTVMPQPRAVVRQHPAMKNQSAAQ